MILVEIGFLGVKADIVGNAAWLETFTVSVIIPLMLEIVTVSVISPLSFFAATAVAKDIIASPKLNPKAVDTSLVVGNASVGVTMGVMIVVAPSPTSKKNPAPEMNPMAYGASLIVHWRRGNWGYNRCGGCPGSSSFSFSKAKSRECSFARDFCPPPSSRMCRIKAWEQLVTWEEKH